MHPSINTAYSPPAPGLSRPPALLLHSCCAVCSSSVLERLSPDYRITVYYYNPNLWPTGEYLHRKQEQQRLIREFPFPNPVRYVDADYNHAEFLAAAAGLEHEPEGGARCRACFLLRLAKTAEYAAQNRFDSFTTTLSVSPHKDAALLNALGQSLAGQYHTQWLHSDFKKKDGYLRATQLARDLSLYRQNYCGCEFSLPKEIL